MSELVFRVAWFSVAALAVSFATYLIVGSIVNAHAGGADDRTVIRDIVGPGSHHLSGMVMVPSPCHELSLRTEAISPTRYQLLFRTWHEPSVDCKSGETPRPFHAVLFAPAAGVDFFATLDDKTLPIQVFPVVREY